VNEWLTAKQAAEYAKCHVQSLYLGVKRRKLRAARINGSREYRFLREWIDAWLMASVTIEVINPEAPGADLVSTRRH
jgi:excisionase family DNA binding protein